MNANLDFGNAVDQLQALSVRVGDKEGLAKAVGATVLDLIRAGFESGTSPSGQAWEPLKVRVGGKPLLDTGDLRDSIQALVTGGGQSIELLADRVQAAIQQFGGTIYPRNGQYLAFPGAGGHPIFAKQVTIPARPYLPDGDFSQSWAAAIDATMTRFLQAEAA